MFISQSQFIMIPASVQYDDALPAKAKLLYGEIYRLSQQEGYCFATNKQIAQLMHCSERTISRLVGALKEQGHITVTTEQYMYTMQRRMVCVREQAEANKAVHPPAQDCLGGVDKAASHTIYKKNNKKNTPIVPKDLVVVSKDLVERIDEYCDGNAPLATAIVSLLENRHAVDRRKAVKTLRSLNGILHALDKHSGGDPTRKIALLDQAITANWLTVYPFKQETPAPKPVRPKGEYMDGI